MALGLCCQYIEKVTKRTGTVEYKNLCEERTLQFGKFNRGEYSDTQIEGVWNNNTSNILKIIKRINSENIKVFRISSGLLPLYDLKSELLKQSKIVRENLEAIGSFVKDNNIRLTTHPDQFLVLSSNTPSIVDKSIMMFEHFSWIFDSMQLDATPFYAINVHGGTKGNSKILIESIGKLGSNAKSRLTLENDERSYNVKDLYEVFEQTGTPILFDSHHHVFNTADLSIEQGLDLAKKTWTCKQLTHLSNTEPALQGGNFTERRKHSDYIHYIPECQRIGNNDGLLDIEVEAKMKNLCIFKMVEDFDIKIS